MLDGTKARAGTRMQSGALWLAVLLSGSASLMYQVAWTRRLATVTTVTVTAQAIVLAIFMAGLGAGALLAAGRARRSSRPLLGYIRVECGAAMLALASMPLITGSDVVRTIFSQLGGSLVHGMWVQLVVVSLLSPTPCRPDGRFSALRNRMVGPTRP